jgi:hypothetical protein
MHYKYNYSGNAPASTCRAASWSRLNVLDGSSTHAFCDRRAQSGSVLSTVLILTLAASIVAASVLSNAITALRLSHRNDVRAQMTAIADSELEWLYFNVKMAVMSGTQMHSLADNVNLNAQADIGETPETVRNVYLDLHRAQGWRVQRSVRHLLTTSGIDRSNGGSRRALLDYIEAKIIVLAPATGPFSQLPPIKLGRYFVASQSTIFQYGVFYEGDLDLNPGENYTIDGDIYASGDAYIAPYDGASITVNANAKLRLLSGKSLNGSDDPDLAGGTRYNPNAPGGGSGLVDPFFSLTGNGSPGEQLENLQATENLLGGLDAVSTAKGRADLFGPFGKTDPTQWDAADLDEAVNNVRRSLITPPPAASNSSEYPNSPSTDDPTIAVQRAYNRAGLVVTVAADGTVSVQKRGSNGALTNVTTTYQASGPVASATPVTVYDAREGRNISVTEVNISALTAKLADETNFNGLLYVNLQNSSNGSPAAVRVINGETVPTTASGSGLSIATNGGLYVKGSYNTTPNASGNYPSSMLMADAITVLSYNWDDAQASGPLTGRTASVDNPTTAGTTETSISINAGLITGSGINTALTPSGGAQNLVRYLESWTGKPVNLFGSLGRLFESRHFSRPISAVYTPPIRNVTYDSNLSTTPPAGAPIISSFSKGDIFRF